MQFGVCPKCTHILSAPAESCPRCGVVFAKLRQAEERQHHAGQWPLAGFSRQLRVPVREGENSAVIAVKAAFLLFLAVYGLRLILTPILEFPDTSWWLHAVNLVFHEAGHLLLMPFGRFMQVLGGSLGQLLVPLVVVIAFLLRGDGYGAVVGSWWLGESFLDIAPYINDARAGQLMLLGGVTGREVEDYHDWEILLTRLGIMQYDHALARFAFFVGTMLMLTAMLWGGLILFKGWQLRSRL